MKKLLLETKSEVINGELKITDYYLNEELATINNKVEGWYSIPHDVDCSPKCRGVLSDGSNEICIGGECIIMPITVIG